MSKHVCHAERCNVACAPERLMCRKHWFMVPQELRNAVWKAYRPGQCDDKRPSRSWLIAARLAILAVATKEKIYTSEEALARAEEIRRNA